MSSAALQDLDKNRIAHDVESHTYTPFTLPTGVEPV